MTEPKRWVDDGAPITIERMLRAAADEQPSEISLDRTLGAVGVGAAVLTSTSASAAVGSAVKTASATAGSWFTKWTLLGLVLSSAVGVATGVSIVRHEAPRPASPLAQRRATALHISETRAQEQRQPATPPVETTVQPVSVPEQPRAYKTAPSAEPETAVDPADGMAEETKCVDRARNAAAAGNPAATLAALDDYERRYPVRRFAPEALYLRMTALTAQGRVAEARQVAAHLLEAYPRSAQAGLAKSILGRTNP